jgi:hypothetical protein
MGLLDPIGGVSLELYAELVAEMNEVLGDLEACAKIAEAHGIARADWDAAVSGWNARLHSTATCDEMAIYYLPLVNAALERRGLVPEVSLDEFARMTAAVNCKGGSLAKMYQEFHTDAVKWSQIASRYGFRILHEPAFAAEVQKRVLEEMALRDAGAKSGGGGRGVT